MRFSCTDQLGSRSDANSCSVVEIIVGSSDCVCETFLKSCVKLVTILLFVEFCLHVNLLQQDASHCKFYYDLEWFAFLYGCT